MSRYVGGDVILNSTTIRQILSSDFSAVPEIIEPVQSTAVDPATLFAGQFEPIARFTTTDIAGVLGAISVSTGLAIGANAITIPYRTGVNAAEFAGSGSHVTITSSTGALIIIESISGQLGEDVQATVAVHYFANAGESPFTVATNANYAAESHNATHAFAHATLTSSGPTTTSPDITGWTVTPGITLEKHASVVSSTGRGPAFISIARRNPMIELQARSLANLSVLTAHVKAPTGATVYGRKRAGLSTFVADGTSEHLAFALGDALACQTVQGSSRSNAGYSLQIKGLALTGSATTALA